MMQSLPVDFDPEQYLALNDDLRLGKVDPVKHYLNHGRAEGRAYRVEMLALFPKLNNTFENDGIKTVHNHDFMIDPAYLSAYERGLEAAGQDYRWYWRVHMGLWAARTAYRLTGDFVECGVNRGFLSSAIMHDLDWNTSGRKFWLLDTFAGMDPRYVSSAERAAGVLTSRREKLDSGFYTSSFEQVQQNFSQWPDARIVVGAVPDTLPEVAATSVAFLHIDMNCAPPEVAAIDWFWPMMPAGGIVLLDDYAYRGYQPQKEAMDAWAAENGVHIASLPTGQGLLVKT